jgi:hypothetical protein
MSTVLELLGLVLLATGLGLLAPWLGVAAAGTACIILGLALDRKGASGAPPAPVPSDGIE